MLWMANYKQRKLEQATLQADRVKEEERRKQVEQMKIDSAERVFAMEARIEQMAEDQKAQLLSIREEIEQEKQQASSVKEALSTQVG